jgi:hypothetical protein
MEGELRGLNLTSFSLLNNRVMNVKIRAEPRVSDPHPNVTDAVSPTRWDQPEDPGF